MVYIWFFWRYLPQNLLRFCTKKPLKVSWTVWKNRLRLAWHFIFIFPQWLQSLMPLLVFLCSNILIVLISCYSFHFTSSLNWAHILWKSWSAYYHNIFCFGQRNHSHDFIDPFWFWLSLITLYTYSYYTHSHLLPYLIFSCRFDFLKKMKKNSYRTNESIVL